MSDALRRITMRLVADAGGKGPKWNPLFPKGEWVHHSGKHQNYTPEQVAEFIASWKAQGSPALPVFFRHAPNPDAKPSVKDMQDAEIAYGWIEDLRAADTDADVSVEALIAWNKDGRELIDNDRVRFISPEWSMQHIDRRTGELAGPVIYAAALTNDPFFNSMPRVAASASPAPTHQPTTEARKAEENTMTEAQKEIRRQLGLLEAATDAEVSEKLKANAAEAEKLKATVAAMEAEKLTASASKGETAKLAAELAVLKASNEAITSQLKAAEEARNAGELKSLLDAAQREGKAMPETLRAAMADYAKVSGLDAAKKMIASLPVAFSPGKEKGISGNEDNTDAQKLFAAAKADLVKAEGIKPSEAHMRIVQTNPELARKAGHLAITPKEN